MYHGAVQEIGPQVLEYVRKHDLIHAGDRVGVAVSGGLDSVALLHLLLALRKELGIVLSVIHFNHQLRAEDADSDEQFVADLAKRCKLALHCGTHSVRDYASQKHLSTEAAARHLRYQYFTCLLGEGVVDRVATAHTLDDQAETVLLRLARGTGTRGLAGIYPQFSVLRSQFRETGADHQAKRSGSVIRPLLATRRKDLEAYLRSLGQDWHEDRSNRDLRFARNRVRHGILPRLERHLNPSVREALAETADIARAEEQYWQEQLARSWPQIYIPASPDDHHALAISLPQLQDLPLALQRRIIRAAAEKLGLSLEFRHVEEVLTLAAARRGMKSVILPEGWRMQRVRDELHFLLVQQVEASPQYEYSLPIPGRVEVPEITAVLEILLVSGEARQRYNAGHLFDPTLLAKDLRVRNWRAGDRFWPAHTKSARKVKELLQDRHITGPQRKLWPVVVSGDELIWVRGLPSPARLQPKAESDPVAIIRETPLPEARR